MFEQQRAVARRIRAAQSSGQRTLDLSGLALPLLPESIGLLSNLTELSLDDNQLTTLPESITQLSKLTTLYLDRNQLTALPESIGQLSNLTELSLDRNRLTALPESIGQLSKLTTLYLGRNEFAVPPESINQLTRLTTLDLGGVELTALPDWVGELTNLTRLNLAGNKIAKLPESLGRLTNLVHLDLDGNQLTELPDSLGQLTKLVRLHLGGNRLVYPPAAVLAEGTEAMLAFLRAGQAGSERQWASKLLIVGEGGAGKTTLLKVLTGGVADPQEQTTHGLNIKNVALPHPSEPDVTMHLSAWDFGGQHVYHATHQFFLTDQSLFLLVWNARAGWEHSKGRYWLDIVNARTGGNNRQAAPVILVATHSQVRAPDLPLSELRRDYPNILASVDVDCLADDNTGIDRLRRAVTYTAVQLPLMGSNWPATWTAAQQAVRDTDRNRMGIEAFNNLLAAFGIVDSAGQQAVTGTLHRLGQILHYAEDPELSGTVVLKPAWLSERIAAILDCRPVAARHGLLTADDIAREWPDVGSELQKQLLFLMDRYDVSYRIADTTDNARAIVVDRVPWEPPDDHADWQAAIDAPGHHELRLHYTMAGTIPPGIPGWFIAHAHRFATTRHRPWRTGVMLAHPDGDHLGLLQLDEHTRTVELAVRGPRPAGFLGLLDLDFTQATLKRYPGLPVTRTVPCRCNPGCPTAWPHTQLVERERRGKTIVECGVSLRDVSISELLDGIVPVHATSGDPTLVTASLKRMEISVNQIIAMMYEQGALLREQGDLLHLWFPQLMSWIKVTTPTVFTVTEKPRRLPGAHRYLLRLYCAEPNAVHQLPDNAGCYPITALDPWIGSLTRHLTTVAGLLSSVTGLTGSILGKTAPELLARGNEDLKKLRDFLDHVKAGSAIVGDRFSTTAIPHSFTSSEAETRKVEELLKSLDPHRNWGGLTKTLTPGGLTLYLCQDHAQAYNSPSPRPHGL